MIKNFLIAIFLGLIATIYFVQNDRWVHDTFTQTFKPYFEATYGCTIDYKIKNINFFTLSIELENVHCTPKQNIAQKDYWQWHTQSAIASFSWFSLLRGMLGLQLYFDQLQVKSAIAEGKMSFVSDHINKFLYGSSLNVPLYLKSLNFKDGTLIAIDTTSNTSFQLQWNSQSKRIDDIIKSQIYLYDSSCTMVNRKLFSQLSGQVSLDVIGDSAGFLWKSAFQVQAHLEHMQSSNKVCFMNGTWDKDHGSCTFKSADQKIEVNPIAFKIVDKELKVDANARLPLSYVMNLVDPNLKNIPLDGDCTIQAQFDSSVQALSGNCVTSTVHYKDLKILDAMRFSFHRNNNQKWHGVLALEHNSLIQLAGQWQCDENPFKGHIELTNKTGYTIPYVNFWDIKENDIRLTINVDDRMQINSSYNITISNEKQDKNMKLDGTCILDKSYGSLKGSINKDTYDACIKYDPIFRLISLHYNDENNSPLIALNVNSHNEDECNGQLQFSLFHQLIHKAFNYNLQGQGIMQVRSQCADEGIKLHTHLVDGTVRIPQTYNAVNDFSIEAQILPSQKKIIIDTFICNLFRGALQAERGILQWDDEYKISYVYMPVTLNSCVLNFKKDLFVVLSGSLLLTKKDDSIPSLQGNLIIERSQLKENLLSDTFQKSLFAHTSNIFDTSNGEMHLNISIETQHPIKVETPFLQASAKTNIFIKNNLLDPQLSGSIEILNGSINFPYRPLNITKGSIIFMPDQLYDPIIELVAKNKIKKYNVVLQVNGSLQNHTISLESTPSLSEEHIVALLLVGSDQNSLNTMVPALLAQNLKTLIFDNVQSPLKMNNYLVSWLKPFSNVHLVPSFTDQTGRGGLRGTIEIDINDNLRATAQKNFSLSEDTRLEVEYSLSDDVSVRGIRDERKDVGGEVEMRWKFGG